MDRLVASLDQKVAHIEKMKAMFANMAAKKQELADLITQVVHESCCSAYCVFSSCPHMLQSAPKVKEAIASTQGLKEEVTIPPLA